MRKFLTSIFVMFSTLGGAHAESLQTIVLNDLDTKIYWFDYSVKSNFAWLVRDAQSQLNFDKCLSGQPWSVGDLVKCCMQNYTAADNVSKCTDFVNVVIESHNASLTTGNDFASDKRVWKLTCLDDVAYNVFGKERNYLIVELFRLFDEIAVKVQSDGVEQYSLSSKELSAYCRVAISDVRKNGDANYSVVQCNEFVAQAEKSCAVSGVISQNNSGAGLDKQIEMSLKTLDSAVQKVYGKAQVVDLMVEMYDWLENIVGTKAGTGYLLTARELQAACNLSSEALRSQGKHLYTEAKCDDLVKIVTGI